MSSGIAEASYLIRERMDFAWAKADLVFAYRQYARLMEHWRAVLPRERFIEVDYEALIAAARRSPGS
jgi:hypothetical protein